MKVSCFNFCGATRPTDTFSSVQKHRCRTDNASVFAANCKNVDCCETETTAQWQQVMCTLQIIEQRHLQHIGVRPT